MFFFFRRFFQIKYKFIIPKRTKILIYKDFDINFDKYSEKKVSFFRYPKELNLFILLRSIFLNGTKNLYLNYLKTYICFTDPKFIITKIDNDINFYRLKKFFKKKIFIAIQNGYRSDIGCIRNFFKELKYLKEKNLQSDFLFSFNKRVGDEYKKFIKTKIIVLGSFRNNLVRIKKSNLKKKYILFISQFAPQKSATYLLQDNKQKVFWKDHNSAEKIIFKFLYKFCKENKFSLKLIPKTSSQYEYYIDKKLIP